MMNSQRLGPRGSTTLTDIRFSLSQSRTNFTKIRDNPRASLEKGPRPDLITLITLISQIYRTYGEEVVPIRQYHPSRETHWNRGHTSSVSHTRIGRHGMPETLEGEMEESKLNPFEVIIVKRPRENVLEDNSRALISFITELRIRTHPKLREHPNIARFRGVGWDFEDADNKIPRPLLLEELAPQGSLDNFWEKWPFVSLNFQLKLDLCRNVAEGLTALHECGVVHGDVKPENILIFPTRADDNAFIAKLTDFGHSVFESSRLDGLPAFTKRWCAPELSHGSWTTEEMSFQAMKETDYYSYGLVILSIMISQPFYECLDDSDDELEKSKGEETMLDKCNSLLRQVDKEKHDSELDLSVTSALLRRTVRLDSKLRSLKRAIQVMRRYDKANERENKGSQPRITTRDSVIPKLNIADMVAVGHTTLSSTSYQLKSYIVERLLLIASSNEPRRLAAAWELSICYFSGFGVDVSFEKCSQWLTVAYEGGIIAAQHYFDVIHQAMSMPCPNVEWKRAQTVPVIDERQSPPEIAFVKGLALDGDERDSDSDSEDIDGQRSRFIASTIMPRKLFEIVSEGDCDELQSYVREYPEYLNSRDAGGATPLVLTAKFQRADMVQFLANEPMTNANITTHEGHTVLHFLHHFETDLNTQLVPVLVKKHAHIHHQALSGSSATEGSIFSSGIRCCSILNAILQGNIGLLQTLLMAAHQEKVLSSCKICELGSNFRRILAVALSIFQAEGAHCLIRHIKDYHKTKPINFDKFRVWAGQDLVPLHRVPFNSVVIGASDLPESFFRAINYGSKYSTALQKTIDLLLSIVPKNEELETVMYSMLTSAVKSNNVDAVQILLQQAKEQGLRKRWWLQGPLDDCPFMLSISYGFRDIYKSFLREEPSVLREYADLHCWEPSCRHEPSKVAKYLPSFLPRLMPKVTGNERRHKLNLVQKGIWVFVKANHQDKFFLDDLLDASNSELIAKEEPTLILGDGTIREIDTRNSIPWSLDSFQQDAAYRGVRRVDGGNFLELAIRYSLFTNAISMTESHPGIWLKEIPRSPIWFWQSKTKAKLRKSSRPMIQFVLNGGSYEQCEFVLKNLLLLRRTEAGLDWTTRARSNVKSCHIEDGVSQWARCPLLVKEFKALLAGNIRWSRPDRQQLWDVIEEQVKMGHSTSGDFLRRAIAHGNPGALQEMLRRGWTANGPIWARLMTPLQYSKSLKDLDHRGDFEYLFRQRNPDLPQNEWIGSASHAVTYKAYMDQLKGHSWTEWSRCLEACQKILEKEGGRIHPLGLWIQTRGDAIRLCSYVFGSMIYAIALPLTLVYGTTGTWTAMNTNQKFVFAYLWSLLCYFFPPIVPLLGQWVRLGFHHWAGRFPPLMLMFAINHFALPLIIVQLNWQPFLSCLVVMGDAAAIDPVQDKLTCTNYTYLLPLAVGGAEFTLWFFWQMISPSSVISKILLLGI